MIPWGNSCASSKRWMTGATWRRPNSRASSRTACCSRVSAKSMCWLDRRPDVLSDEANDVLGRGARGEQLLHAERLEGPDVVGGNDAAAEHRDVVGPLLAQQLEHPGEQIVVGPREHGEPDGVGVLLNGGGDDLLGGLMQARVDHLEARVPERPRDDLGAAIVAVEPRLGHHHADLAL